MTGVFSNFYNAPCKRVICSLQKRKHHESFLPENSWEEIAEEIFFFHISFWCLTWDTNPASTFNKPTHYLLRRKKQKVERIKILEKSLVCARNCLSYFVLMSDLPTSLPTTASSSTSQKHQEQLHLLAKATILPNVSNHSAECQHD